MPVFTCTVPCPAGALIVSATPVSIIAVHWCSEEVGESPVSHSSCEGASSPNPVLLQRASEELREYLASARTRFTVPWSVSGTPFQTKVWEALSRVPYGATWSYRELAQAVGAPRAVRAVANAVAANPIAIILPCHRIVCSDGTLGGYAGGVARKQWLLDMERNRPVQTASSSS